MATWIVEVRVAGWRKLDMASTKNLIEIIEKARPVHRLTVDAATYRRTLQFSLVLAAQSAQTAEERAEEFVKNAYKKLGVPVASLRVLYSVQTP